MSNINILDLIKHTDQVTASFQSLLLPCPFCGKILSNKECESWNGKPHISCACGASMGFNMGILELISCWNRRDGVEFTLESAYAQRLIAVQSELANCKSREGEIFAHMQKEITLAGERAAKSEQELAQLREVQS